MKTLAFWKTIVGDRSDFLDRLVAELARVAVPYCVVGGQAVNAYVEPLVSLDLDLAVRTDRIDELETLLGSQFVVSRFPHSVNISAPDSGLRVQFQTDPRYAEFVSRSSIREVLGLRLPVAALEDVLQGKIWAALDESRRPSKRQKDLADIARIIESHPRLREHVPDVILARLV
jgi:hypothetical protein